MMWVDALCLVISFAVSSGERVFRFMQRFWEGSGAESVACAYSLRVHQRGRRSHLSHSTTWQKVACVAWFRLVFGRSLWPWVTAISIYTDIDRRLQMDGDTCHWFCFVGRVCPSWEGWGVVVEEGDGDLASPIHQHRDAVTHQDLVL